MSGQRDVGISYAEYLRETERQRQRDADRYEGRDSHPELPAYDSRDGRQVHAGRAVAWVELDADGWPIVRAYSAPTKEAEWALRRAVGAAALAKICRKEPQEAARDAEANHRQRMADRQAEAEKYKAEHPFVCPCRARYKTARGLMAHQRRSMCRRERDPGGKP